MFAAAGSEAAADVWLWATPTRYVDGVGRAVGWPGAGLIAQAARSKLCPAAPDGPCRPRRGLDGRSRCPACGLWWSAAQVPACGAVARSADSVGIDVEDRRRRPAAWRRASVFSGVTLTGPEHWTQGEALWKAAGRGRRDPQPGEIPVPVSWVDGWQASRDNVWWIYTDGHGPNPWSVALPKKAATPPRLRVAGVP
ncbi:MAG: hypothetical protein LBH76_08135 [Propionibacteriaceae bacterium]|jgi:hypothetical protein|nr:hypothetical protein [Propionibacteriaceae bacterium]